MARIGTVSYINALPLVDGLAEEGHDLTRDSPAGIAACLESGDVDAALVPIGALLNATYEPRMVPRWCIGCEGAVRSVLLVSRVPIDRWTSVHLDACSRTSVMLARLLLEIGPLAKDLPEDCDVIMAPEGAALDGAGPTDAALVIGDAALNLSDEWRHRIDLGQAWADWQGLPFVFAVWAGRHDLAAEVRQALVAAGHRGARALQHAQDGAHLDYLRHAIRYTLDDRALLGLRTFCALAHHNGLCTRDTLTFFAPDIQPSHASLEEMHSSAMSRADALSVFRDAPLVDLMARADACVQRPSDGESRAIKLLAVGAQQDALYVENETGCLSAAFAQRHGRPDPASWTRRMEMRAADGATVVALVEVGAGETDEELVDHLFALAAFHERSGMLEGVRVRAARTALPIGSGANTAIDVLRAVALTRLILNDVAQVWVSPDEQGLSVAQVALRAGVDVLGPLDDAQMNAGDWSELERHVVAAGFSAVRVGAEAGR